MNETFQKLRTLHQLEMSRDRSIRETANTFMNQSVQHKYSYNFDWLSRPIIQYPQDIVAFQEIVWTVKPDLIIETGIAHGGSLILSASLMALLDLCEATENNALLDVSKPKRKVIGIDIDIRKKNKIEIERHPLSNRIQMLQGSSIDAEIFLKVENIAQEFQKVLVCLDSNHTHEHVLNELEKYSNLVSKDSYCIVWDTVIDDLEPILNSEKNWGKCNSPKTAVHKFLKTNNQFEIDKSIENKLLLTVAPSGFLKRVKTKTPL